MCTVTVALLNTKIRDPSKVLSAPLSSIEVMNLVVIATFCVQLWSSFPVWTTREGRGDPVNMERAFIRMERKNYPGLELL